MYNEISLINKINDKKDKLNICLLFIEEYGGWKNHLENIGLQWGANGEENGAARELNKTKKHITKLRQLVINECL